MKKEWTIFYAQDNEIPAFQTYLSKKGYEYVSEIDPSQMDVILDPNGQGCAVIKSRRPFPGSEVHILEDSPLVALVDEFVKIQNSAEETNQNS